MNALLFIAAVVALLVFVYINTIGYLDSEVDTALGLEMQALVDQYNDQNEADMTQVLAKYVAQTPGNEYVYSLIDGQGRTLAGNLDDWPSASPVAPGWADFETLAPGGKDKTRHTRGLIRELSDQRYLLVGRDVSERDHAQDVIRGSLLWALGFSIVLALGVGIFASSRVAQRLEEMHSTAQRIMKGDLNQRVHTYDSGDDFDQVAHSLNAMLDRIEALMATVQQFSNNVAHDLRKPLTRLRHRLEEAESADPEEAALILEKASRESDELMSTFDALLRIARIESRSRRSAFQEIDASALLSDVGEFYEPAASEQDLKLTVHAEPNIKVEADRDLLFQAVANLVDNAVKYTPPGGAIMLSAKHTDNAVLLAVADSGPGVPPELRPKVLERFFRADDSRTKPGNGLGLSLVQAIADLHEADIRLSDAEPGLRVELLLPQARSAESASANSPTPASA